MRRGTRKENGISREITLDLIELLIKMPRTVKDLIGITGSKEETIRKHLRSLQQFDFAFPNDEHPQVWRSCLKRRDQMK